jgi:predicted aminopeptidase
MITLVRACLVGSLAKRTDEGSTARTARMCDAASDPTRQALGPALLADSIQIILRIAFLLSVSGLAGGCAQLGYYTQAVQGHFAVLAGAKPIDHWLADPDVRDDLKVRLKRVREIRTFAAKELALPDNGSYTRYADLKRQYVLWNVVATPEFSLKPEQWCFPVAGCVDYRGYYSREAAQSFAAGLSRQNLDVRVTGVPAYSTLGWFNDPVLSTFIEYPEAELARLIFHELAHQVAYAPGDSQFNESFATIVEEVGVMRWLEARGSAAMHAEYIAYQERKKEFLALLSTYAHQLEENFNRPVSDAEKRQRKAEIFADLQQRYAHMKQAKWGGYTGYDRWFGERMTNAHFALISTYHDLVPAFRAMLTKEKHLLTFYQSVRKLAKMDNAARRQVLSAYLPPEPSSPSPSQGARIETTVIPTAAMQ